MKKSANIVDIYTLSPLQEGILFHSIYQKEASAYFVQTAHRLRGELDVDLVQHSMQRLVDRHDSLRTSFVYEEMDQPLQVVLRNRELPFHSEDLRHLPSPEAQEAYLEEFKQKDRERYFNLTQDCLIRGAVFRLSEREYEFIWSCHHIIIDGWCLKTIEYEFFAFYEHAREGKNLQLPPAPQYKRYIQWLDQSSEARSTAFWQNYLNDFAQPTNIPQLLPRHQEIKAFDNKTFVLEVPSTMSQELRSLAQRKRTTVNNIVRSVWGILLGKYNDRQDAVFGAVVSGRPPQLSEAEDIVGLFINTVPVRVKGTNEMRFDELLQQVSRESIESEEFHHALLAEVQNLTEHKNQLFDHILVFENYPTNPSATAATVESEEGEGNFLQLINESVFSQNHYPFYVIVGTTPDLKFNFYYNRTLYTTEQVERMADHLIYLMQQCIDNDEIALNELKLVAEKSEEHQELLEAFNATDRPFDGHTSVKDRFEQMVEQYGDHAAISSELGNYTYRELNEQSNKLAKYLIENTSSEKDTPLVGVLTTQPSYAITAMLATVKAGMAFVPIYPELPVNSIENVLKESQVDQLILDSTLLDRVESYEGGLFVVDIQMDMLANEPENPTVEIATENPLYVIFSSGTTGKPKGVVVSNRSLLNYVDWMKTEFDFNSNYRGALMSSYAYDLGYTTVWSCLLNGATLYLPATKVAREPEVFLDYLLQKEISFLKLTPSHFKVLMASSRKKELANSALEMVFLGGEKIHPPSISEFWSIRPSTRFVNHYGPTETTIGVITHSIDPEAFNAFQTFPLIGSPIANCRAFVLDENKRMLPIGAIGDLYIAGQPLALGYLSNPELTAAKFAKLPWGELAYHTGDKVRRHENGAFEFLGRADSEAKIRGYRVDRSEIVAMIQEHPAVDFASVQTVKDTEDEARLVAFVQFREETESSVLLNFLKSRLPEYMWPSQIVAIDKPPLTANGKLNVRALLKLAVVETRRELVAPANETEKVLVDIWKEVLGKKEVSTDDDFFDLGGHSLKAVQIISRIIVDFKVTLAVKDIFDNTSIAQLAPVVVAEMEAATSDQSVDEVII